eukprot:COSAG01_NODE_42373_length_440_cov_3.718475_1_plen_69_part_10
MPDVSLVVEPGAGGSRRAGCCDVPMGTSKSRLKAERISLPEEPAGAAIRAPSALDVPADWLLEAFLEAF